MPSETQIDIKRLRADVAKTMAARPIGVAPDGRPFSGAMAAVRKILPELEALHKDATWRAIAESLSAQGIVTRAGAVMTGKQLTALIAAIHRQDASRRAQEARRGARSDLARGTTPTTGTARKAKLAPELTQAPAPAASPSSLEVEDQIRRSNFEKHSRLFREDSK